MPERSKRREIGEVSNWFKQRGYGFVTREGRESSFASDIQLHIANAKGQRLKAYLEKHGLMLGAKIKYAVDFEQNKGKAFAAEWELVDAPDFNGSRSRSSERKPATRARRSPSYGGARKSPSYGRTRKSPSYGRASQGRRGSPSPVRKKAKRSESPKRAKSKRPRSRSDTKGAKSRSWSRRRPRSGGRV
mmetsp:Transcript_8107/g.10572  ORF Transcript_8107/g.10572 Transcript_8107/m.10572 type:complete len:189 (-) Transcript_8107:141-707(-)